MAHIGKINWSCRSCHTVGVPTVSCSNPLLCLLKSWILQTWYQMSLWLSEQRNTVLPAQDPTTQCVGRPPAQSVQSSFATYDLSGDYAKGLECNVLELSSKASCFFAPRLRSLVSKIAFLIRIVLGVISTNSSSLIHSIACSSVIFRGTSSLTPISFVDDRWLVRCFRFVGLQVMSIFLEFSPTI